MTERKPLDVDTIRRSFLTFRSSVLQQANSFAYLHGKNKNLDLILESLFLADQQGRIIRMQFDVESDKGVETVALFPRPLDDSTDDYVLGNIKKITFPFTPVSLPPALALKYIGSVNLKIGVKRTLDLFRTNKKGLQLDFDHELTRQQLKYAWVLTGKSSLDGTKYSLKELNKLSGQDKREYVKQVDKNLDHMLELYMADEFQFNVGFEGELVFNHGPILRKLDNGNYGLTDVVIDFFNEHPEAYKMPKKKFARKPRHTTGGVGEADEGAGEGGEEADEGSDEIVEAVDEEADEGSVDDDGFAYTQAAFSARKRRRV